jgi:hypothetical protein
MPTPCHMSMPVDGHLLSYFQDGLIYFWNSILTLKTRTLSYTGARWQIVTSYLCTQPQWVYFHGRMTRGGHGLPKVPQGPAFPYPSMPYGQGWMGLCSLCGHGHTLQGNQLQLCRAVWKSVQGKLKEIDKDVWEKNWNWAKLEMLYQFQQINLESPKWSYFLSILMLRK